MVLTGPDPRELVEPITADKLRAEMRWALGHWQAWYRSIDSINRRALAVAVLTHTRILHTLAIGEVSSKTNRRRMGTPYTRPGVGTPNPLGTRRPPRPLDEGAARPPSRPPPPHAAVHRLRRWMGCRTLTLACASDASMSVKSSVAVRVRVGGRGCGRGSA